MSSTAVVSDRSVESFMDWDLNQSFKLSRGRLAARHHKKLGTIARKIDLMAFICICVQEKHMVDGSIMLTHSSAPLRFVPGLAIISYDNGLFSIGGRLVHAIAVPGDPFPGRVFFHGQIERDLIDRAGLYPPRGIRARSSRSSRSGS